MRKKSTIWINLSVISVVILMITSSCEVDVNGTVVAYTTDKVPTLTTIDLSNISQTLAISGGNISSDGGASVTSRGVCWNTTTNPTTALSTKTTDGAGSGTFSSNITGLTTATTYYVRAYAINSIGTAYGNEISFKTRSLGQIGSVTDIDGNVYKTITIGAQEWMTENLKTTKYRDGTIIPFVDDNTQWKNLSTNAYCDYNNNSSNASTYGHLYNWFAINNSHNIAPAGWHVPTIAEWTTLINYLGGETLAGGKMKETGTSLWRSPNTDADNSSGFSALPGGNRSGDTGLFFNNGSNGYWWTSTQYDANNATMLTLFYNNGTITQANNIMKGGNSVRCVKN